MKRSEYRKTFKHLRAIRFLVEKHRVASGYQPTTTGVVGVGQYCFTTFHQRKIWRTNLDGLAVCLSGYSSGIDQKICDAILFLITAVWSCQVDEPGNAHNKIWEKLFFEEGRTFRRSTELELLAARVQELYEIMDLKPADFAKRIMLLKLTWS
jgi:hypothetical protein